MSTPEICGSGTIKSKYSPFGNAIRKSLLTPCRQVGLSRKRKTPLSNPIKSSEVLSSNNINVSSRNDSNNETTPVNHSKFFKKRRKNEDKFLNCKTSSNEASFEESSLLKDNENLLETCDIKSSKKDLLRTFTSEDLFDTSDDQPCSLEKKEITQTTENTLPHMKENVSQVSNIEYVQSKKTDVQQNAIDDKKTLKKKLSSDLKNSIKNQNSLSQTPVNHNSDDDFMVSKSSNTQRSIKQKEAKRRNKTLSPKKSSLSVASDTFKSDLEENNCTKKCNIQLRKLSENEINSSRFIDGSPSIKTLSKIRYSDGMDDADFFTSTPEEEKVKRKKLEQKMRLLETDIKQKQSVLENFERASIYRSKHNIPELKRLTSLWSDGCVKALKDLLAHLQAHGPMDLGTLLNNMQISKDVVAKLPL